MFAKKVKYFSIAVLPLLAIIAFSSCKSEVGYTSIHIEDSIRHYYPILRGQELKIALKIDNTGDHPLVIRDIQTSCGCVTTDFTGRTIVPPGRYMYVTIVYDSNKNSGYAKHTVRFWGNMEPDGFAIMRFDVNIVPDANYHYDYEQLFDMNREKLKDLIDGVGTETGLGYYTDF